MAQQNLILCIDIGGVSIKAAEFSYVPGQSLNLERFAYTEYEVADGEPVEEAVLRTLADVIKTNRFAARDVYVSLSGENAFVRFVKVPAMTTNKDRIREIISYEAKQAMPFPADEVVWDAQILEPTAESDGSEIDAMIVIVKKEVVSRISELIEKLGKRISLIEVAGTSCYNSARANNVGAAECQMILDIGGRCSTLIFLDGPRFFVRTIPIAGDAITQQIAKEFNISYADAEEMKRKHGYVSLGGAYEEAESEVASAVSKIVRNVMTRLHGEINRSINVYRATQKGRKPEKLYLAGGTSILPYAPRFFSEKLRIPVEYLNPFQVVGIGSAVDQQVLSEVAHLFAETIGLALRRIGTCPVEISLVPDYICKQKEFRAKIPYFLISAVSLLLYLAITLWSFNRQAANISAKRDEFNTQVSMAEAIQKSVSNANNQLSVGKGEFSEAVELLKQRNNMIAFYSLFKTCIPDNVWLTSFEISTAPDSKVKNAAALTAANDPETAQKNGGGLSMDTSSEEEQSQEQSSADGESGGPRWINMVAYVICKKKDSYTQILDRDAAINNIISQMSRINELAKKKDSDSSGIFKSKYNEIKIVYDEGGGICDNLTIRKFLLAVELTVPVDSPEMEKTLSEMLAPSGADKEKDKEKESEKKTPASDDGDEEEETEE